MQANLNAIGIILAPLIAILVSLVWGTRYNEKQFLRAALISVLIVIAVVIIVSLLPSDLNLASSYQVFVPLICIFPILWFVRKGLVAYSSIAALIFLAILLTIHYEYLIRTDKYSSSQIEKVTALNNFQRLSINMALYSVVERDSNSYPAGWLSESPLLANFSRQNQRSIIEHCVFDRPRTYRTWNTPFTHIYGAETQYLELWYPGGKLSGETIGTITLKERRDRPQHLLRTDYAEPQPSELSQTRIEVPDSNQKEEPIDTLVECDSGWRYFYGRGVQKDYTKAAKCFRRAIDGVAEQSEQNKLGWCYYRGKGIEPDYNNPVKWFRGEAEKGNADAQYFLGWLYFYGGHGLKPNRTEAVNWWKKSAEQGFAEAQYELAVEYTYLQHDSNEGIKWQYKAAQQDFDMAQREIEMYFQGSDPNYRDAIKLLVKAAEQGSSGAQANLVPLAERGWISMVEGYKWALLAIKNGRKDNWTQGLRQGSRWMNRKPMSQEQIAQAEKLAHDFVEVKSEVSARAITTMYQAMTLRQENMDVPEYFFPDF